MAKVGDKIRIIKGSLFYTEGTHAVLTEIDDDRDWWANFEEADNAEATFERHNRFSRGWCVGKEAQHFEVIA